MANERASTLFGFETPEQVRQRIGKTEQAESAGMFSGGLEEKIFRAAMGGGQMIGGGLAQAAGYEAPEIKAAKARQDIMKNVDLSSANSLYDASKQLLELGDIQGANAVSEKAFQLETLEAQKSKRGAYFTTKTLIGDDGRAYEVPLNTRTGEYDWNAAELSAKDPDVVAKGAGKKKAAVTKAGALAEAQIDLPKVESDSKALITLVDSALAHPGFQDVVGAPSAGKLTQYVPGTEAAGFRALQEQIEGKKFMQAYQTLKGGGQITEIEGTKATNALSRMRTTSSEEEYALAAQEFKKEIVRFNNLARRRANMSPIDIRFDQKANEKAEATATDANGKMWFKINGTWQDARGNRYGGR